MVRRLQDNEVMQLCAFGPISWDGDGASVSYPNHRLAAYSGMFWVVRFHRAMFDFPVYAGVPGIQVVIAEEDTHRPPPDPHPTHPQPGPVRPWIG